MSQAARHFDSLEFVHSLEFAGVKRRHAEAEAKALSSVFTYYFETMASKEDLNILETHLTRQIDDVRKDMENGFQAADHKIENLRKDMESGFQAIDHKIENLRKDMENGFQAADDKIEDLRKEVDARFNAIDNRFTSLSHQLTIRLGSIMCAGIGVLGFLFMY